MLPTMNEAVFHTKNPNGFLAERKHLEVRKVLIGCSGKKRSCTDANKVWKKLSYHQTFFLSHASCNHLNTSDVLPSCYYTTFNNSDLVYTVPV